MGASLRGGPLFQRFCDGASRDTWSLRGGAEVGWLVPTSSPAMLEVTLAAGVAAAPGIAANADHRAAPWIAVGVGALFSID